MPNDADPARSLIPPSAGELIAQRFRVQALLGRGGCGWVFRVRDEVDERLVALKLLQLPADARRAQLLVEQFEREFNSLVELAHPRVVQASDYGLYNQEPFYVLELLDGGDIQTLAPLPWQDVCSLAYDVCSALSLLHSRQLLHRDVTPRNIRRTADGKAKLIDFGLLTPMGVPNTIAGTPPFVAPEAVERSALDARSDLFSLGCTLYFALTGHVSFPARTFPQLPELWQHAPLPPSGFAPDIPRALDELVLELMRIDAGSRPKSAAEVMDRLVPLLAAAPDEELSAARSYLSTPRLVGRTGVVAQLRKELQDSRSGRGAGIFVRGEAGAGRSRILNAFAIEAKLIGATVLRASAIDAAAGPFGVATALATELLEAHPLLARVLLLEDPATFSELFEDTGANALELRLEPGAAPANHFAVQTALRAWFLRAASETQVAIVVDDVDRIDEPSAALLATLSWDAPAHRLVYAVSAQVESLVQPGAPLATLSQHAKAIELAPLSREDLHELLESVFGNVPNLSLLSRRLYDPCGGRPRDCMALAQHLVDRNVIRYAGGTWTLPAELPTGLLPAHMEEALERQLTRLSPVARRVGVLLSLSILERLSRAHLLQLGELTSAEIDRAVGELRAGQLIAGTIFGYALRHASIGRLLTAEERSLEQAHRDLATIFEHTSEITFAIVHHHLLGAQPEAAMEHMRRVVADPKHRIDEIDRAELELGTDRATSTMLLGLRAAEQLARPPFELQMWRGMIAGMCARGADAGPYYRIRAVWLAQLTRDSGYDDWQRLSKDLPPEQRIKLALAAAAARYEETPPERRGAAPGDAIKQLIGYVIMSIAVGVRVLDLQLQRSLPPLLEPFSRLSPLVDAMLWNARATRLNGEGKREEAREVFLRVLASMERLDGGDLLYLDKVRAAIRQTVAEIDASLGVRSDFIARLDDQDGDPNQRVSALYTKMVLALNEGDRDAAERHRHDAELLSLQNKARSMFSTLGQELEAHATARDLTALKRVREAIAAMASERPGWLPVQAFADAHYLRACGDLQGALRAVTRLREAPEWQRASPWCLLSTAIEAELLVELKQPEDAFSICLAAWDHSEREGMHYIARQLGSALALVQAARGRFADAMSHIERVITELEALSVRGIQLERAFEYAARVAIAAEDPRRFASWANRLARPHGLGYERLVGEARRSGLVTQDAAFTSTSASSLSSVTERMQLSNDRRECAQRAIDYLCEATSSRSGHLFLRVGGRLEWTASSGEGDPAAAIRDAAVATYESYVALMASASDLDGATQGWAPTQTEHYTSVLLQVAPSGEPYVVGVAMLGVAQASVDVARVAGALAEQLVRFCQPR
jgi:hypothetical protein